MPDTSKLRLRIFDGTRQLFAAPANFLVTITDGNRTQHVRQFYQQNDLLFDLPFFDNFGDDYTVLVWAKGYRQAGFSPVVLSSAYTKTIDLMLVADDPGFSFVNARFPAGCPILCSFTAKGGIQRISLATELRILMNRHQLCR